MSAFIVGFTLGISIIISLGMQNIFLIKQGARQHYAYLSAAICFICDSALIIIGVLGIGQLITHYGKLLFFLHYLTIAFLMCYAILALKRAINPHYKMTMEVQHFNQRSTKRTIMLLALSFSLLNPQAIMETFIIVGGLGSTYVGMEQWFYIMGVMTSSLIWFYFLVTLTYYLGQRYLKNALAWRLLESVSGVIMLIIALNLLLTKQFNFA